MARSKEVKKEYEQEVGLADLFAPDPNKIAAGIDCHSEFFTVVILKPKAESKKFVQLMLNFPNSSAGIERLIAWLNEHGCSHAAIEATGDYWKEIVYALQDSGLTVTVVNPRFLKQSKVKTDAGDAADLAYLEVLEALQDKKSFIPSRHQARMRHLTRYYTKLVQDKSRLTNRIGKWCLENELNGLLGPKGLGAVMSKAAWPILNEIALAESLEPETIRVMLPYRLSPEKLEAVTSIIDKGIPKLSPIACQMLGNMVIEVAEKEVKLQNVKKLIEQQFTEWTTQAGVDGKRLKEIILSTPGMGEATMWIWIAEVGLDVSPFRDAHQLACWIGLVPREASSGGKIFSSQVGNGNRYLRWALTQAARATNLGKAEKYQSVQRFRHLRLENGQRKNQAVRAVSHKLAKALYHCIRKDELYKGANHSWTKLSKRLS